MDFAGADEEAIAGAGDLRVLEIAANVGIVGQDVEIGTAIEDLLLIWSATEADECIDRLGFVPV
jgi:hypothetical protein